MIFVKPILAQCPVCIITVGGGMFIAKKFGVDDLYMSLWLSALNTVIALWMAPKFKIKLINNPIFLSILFLAFSLLYFQTTSQFGAITNTIFGINKVIFGHILGLFLVIAGSFTDKYIKSKREGKVLFYYQKVVFPLSYLIISTLIFKFLFKI